MRRMRLNGASRVCRCWKIDSAVAVVALIALHQAGRPDGTEHQRDLALLGDVAVIVGDLDAVTRQRPAHRTDLDLLARRIAGERRGFGLAVTVADGQSPRRLHL